MPQIIVMADGTADQRDAMVMFRERVSVDDFDSRHFASQLVERLGWAVGDAHEVEENEESRPDLGTDPHLGPAGGASTG